MINAVIIPQIFLKKLKESDIISPLNQGYGMVEINGEINSYAQALQELIKLAHKNLINGEFKGQINTTQRNKLLSNKAIDKSINNGFTRKAHLLAIVNIDKIFSGASCLGRFDDTKNSQGNLKILRFCSEFILNGEKTKALITAKESIDKKGRKSNNIIKIYSLELLRE